MLVIALREFCLCFFLVDVIYSCVGYWMLDKCWIYFGHVYQNYSTNTQLFSLNQLDISGLFYYFWGLENLLLTPLLIFLLESFQTNPNYSGMQFLFIYFKKPFLLHLSFERDVFFQSYTLKPRLYLHKLNL